ncbi:MAG: hypothetical protein ACKN9T_03975 [Candidatus Methylumidiphilus sp.]
MASKQIAVIEPQNPTGALLLGTSLAFASLILVPALAVSIGMGPSLTGALRIALMKASHRAVGRASNGAEAATTAFVCH